MLQMQEIWVWPWVRKMPWRRAWQPSPVFLPGEFHGQRSLTGYSPLGGKESGTNKVTSMQALGQKWFKIMKFHELKGNVSYVRQWGDMAEHRDGAHSGFVIHQGIFCVFLRYIVLSHWKSFFLYKLLVGHTFFFNSVWFYLYVESKKQNKWHSKQKPSYTQRRNRWLLEWEVMGKGMSRWGRLRGINLQNK